MSLHNSLEKMAEEVIRILDDSCMFHENNEETVLFATLIALVWDVQRSGAV